MKANATQNDRLEISTLLRPVSLSCLFGALATAAVLLAASLLMSLQDISPSLVGPISTFAMVVGSLLSGYLCSRMVRRWGMLLGCVCGGILFVLTMLSGLIFYDTAPGWACMLKLVIMVTGGMVGGVLGVNAQSPLRKRCKIPR